jgi:hypothetical protein
MEPTPHRSTSHKFGDWSQCGLVEILFCDYNLSVLIAVDDDLLHQQHPTAAADMCQCGGWESPKPEREESERDLQW